MYRYTHHLVQINGTNMAQAPRIIDTVKAKLKQASQRFGAFGIGREANVCQWRYESVEAGQNLRHPVDGHQ